jgi:hypothetical protein
MAAVVGSRLSATTSHSRGISTATGSASTSANFAVVGKLEISMEVSSIINQEEQELVMALAHAYLEWERQTEQRGIE